jgi:hypothetical protein
MVGGETCCTSLYSGALPKTQIAKCVNPCVTRSTHERYMCNVNYDMCDLAHDIPKTQFVPKKYQYSSTVSSEQVYEVIGSTTINHDDDG